MNPSTIQFIGATLFAIAIAHTFSTKFFEHLATINPAHKGIWHLMGEVEAVFGFWAMVMMAFMFAIDGSHVATAYLDSRNFTEPMFVFAIMVIAGTRPILQAATAGVQGLARLLPLPGSMGVFFVTLTVVPLLGSFITEPAAMTLAALILSDRLFSKKISTRLKYAALGTLFVNVSIGGTLTSFAAPPVLMVAGKWGWDMHFMMTQIGWKAAVAIVVSTSIVLMRFAKELSALPNQTAADQPSAARTPLALMLVHGLFLVGVVVFSHHPAVFMSLFLFFLGIAHAYQPHQDRLILREGLMVAFFLSGLVVLGGQQQWWLQPVLMSMSSDAVYLGATVLTAVTDNAALTYLGSLVEGLSDEFKYALVTGAVTGGGLTIIANAPNPAGAAILRHHFEDEAISPWSLLLAALGPTLVAAAAFRALP